MTNSFAVEGRAAIYRQWPRAHRSGNGQSRYPGNPKKACQPFKYSIKRICDDKQAIPGVQNIFKKVKKKLVRILDIQ
jgi:hypothetical protein